MIQYVTGDIFESNAEMLVNPVNLQGIMGKGLALQFKQRFPDNFIEYREACLRKDIDVGKLFIYFENGKYIANFPTKTEWKLPSKLEYITEGLFSLNVILGLYKIKSVALPRLGCGLGGLAWSDVQDAIVRNLNYLSVDCFIYGENK